MPNRTTIDLLGIGRHPFGLPGSDNRLAADLRARNVRVVNIPHLVRLFHLHASDVRRYSQQSSDARVAPPYVPVEPSMGQFMDVNNVLLS